MQVKTLFASVLLLVAVGGCGQESKNSASEVKQQQKYCKKELKPFNVYFCASGQFVKVIHCLETICYQHGMEVSRNGCAKPNCVAAVGGPGKPVAPGGASGGGGGGFGHQKPPAGWGWGGN